MIKVLTDDSYSCHISRVVAIPITKINFPLPGRHGKIVVPVCNLLNRTFLFICEQKECTFRFGFLCACFSGCLYDSFLLSSEKTDRVDQLSWRQQLLYIPLENIHRNQMSQLITVYYYSYYCCYYYWCCNFLIIGSKITFMVDREVACQLSRVWVRRFQPRRANLAELHQSSRRKG